MDPIVLENTDEKIEKIWRARMAMTPHEYIDSLQQHPALTKILKDQADAGKPEPKVYSPRYPSVTKAGPPEVKDESKLSDIWKERMAKSKTQYINSLHHHPAHAAILAQIQNDEEKKANSQ